ncbi:MAG TPA: hypothetical protein VM681_07075 [Candidatus Thermoplasmatota archaeon]|nr:hypothetical protein [Candidatus Thermoplasmatota archaeon]
MRLAAFALAALVLSSALPFARGETVAVTGHSVYADMDGFDPCLAAIVGLVRARVMWFNDMVLFSRPAADGSAYVYAVEQGAPDPRERLLYENDRYEFTDPNGVSWKVVEYQYVYNTNGTTQHNVPVPPPAQSPAANHTQNVNAWFTWVVSVGPTTQDAFPGLSNHEEYNFVLLVDTCKFKGAFVQDVSHTRDGSGGWDSDLPDDETTGGHKESDEDHTHQAFGVDLYVGRAPNAAPPPPKPSLDQEVRA